MFNVKGREFFPPFLLQSIENQQTLKLLLHLKKKTMANFTLCKPQRCKLKMSCERYLTKPEGGVPIYFDKEPSNSDGNECPMYFKKNCKTCGEI